MGSGLKRAAEEPYRLLFPLGALAGIWGVMMWPLVYAGGLGFYPLQAHPRIMVEGFVGAFIIGFLGTAFPRMTNSRPWTRVELLLIVAMWIGLMIAHSNGRIGMGDALFTGLLLLVMVTFMIRWRRGWKDAPPPGFVVVLPVFLGTVIATGSLSIQGGSWMGFHGIQIAHLWLYQVFPFLPIMAVGPFLFPRFFGEPSGHSFETVQPGDDLPLGWWKRAGWTFGLSAVFIVSLALEMSGRLVAAYVVRALVVITWLVMETPLLCKTRILATPGTVLRVALAAVVVGFLGVAVRPEARVGMLHLFFAGGIGLITLTVGVRVILGHAGVGERLQQRIGWLWWVAGLGIVAAFTRASSDFLPASRVSHHEYAAWCWALAGIVWLVALGPFFFRSEKG